ncbi:MAG TPA: 2-amino-4-hydroxy-6-hydroxymethyldihydropteridine diphosphokinase [Lacibacter sp.]|nr:2-amino-4-hydroxy-6-hydroxymethyldihydropteridine diphosphokinase [Lacibacter sp.]HMO89400.1 2-amino-4-hydroxy-6-hydroxymethyldihydropteridine diphosphokinase [Lacibacter sp.]HMP88494.1 2-amino-4-hydroxy-6-hydroxymethyldihydropteridine diphosphokinase [Lacibacter sp.]
MSLHRAFILLGGNLGNRQAILQQAAEAIAHRVGTVTRASSLYETAAWGKEDQPPFLNQVLEVHTRLPPDALMETLLNIEQELGRVRTLKMGPRTIDLDVLLYDRLRHESPRITLPHPSLHLRRFVLEPLAELAPHHVHPVLRQRIGTLLRTCPDPLAVTRL